jgi:hypothetical protein
VLEQHARKVLSIRGAFVRLVEEVSVDGILDRTPPVSPRTGGVTLRHVGLSDLPEATANESGQVAAGSRLVHRLLDIRSPSLVSWFNWASPREDGCRGLPD